MKKFLTGTFVLFCLATVSWAQEGMWLLTQLDQIDVNKRGLEIKASDLYSKDKPALFSAILQVGGGTGSFVSPEGLVLTNHHVAFTALQRASSTSSNYLADGFLARTRAEEIKAPGYRALMVTEIRDVTGEVTAAGKGISDATEKEKKINARIAEMTAAIEKDKKDVKASVSQMFNGKQYLLFVYKEFRDMRIVYAPPLSIGNYGGETDNWMWPRHTGDFSFLRVCRPRWHRRRIRCEELTLQAKSLAAYHQRQPETGRFHLHHGLPRNDHPVPFLHLGAMEPGIQLSLYCSEFPRGDRSMR